MPYSSSYPRFAAAVPGIAKSNGLSACQPCQAKEPYTSAEPPALEWTVDREPQNHGSWIMGHGSRVLGAPARGTDRGRDGPSHVDSRDVLMVTWQDGPKLPRQPERASQSVRQSVRNKTRSRSGGQVERAASRDRSLLLVGIAPERENYRSRHALSIRDGVDPDSHAMPCIEWLNGWLSLSGRWRRRRRMRSRTQMRECKWLVCQCSTTKRCSGGMVCS